MHMVHGNLVLKLNFDGYVRPAQSFSAAAFTCLPICVIHQQLIRLKAP
jgi:hypothetical protein